MADVKLLKLNANGVPQEINSGVDSAVLAGLTIANSSYGAKSLTVSASSSAIIDSVLLSDFLSFEYKIALKNLGGTLVRSMMLDGHQVNGLIVDKVTGKAGTGIDYELTASINSGSLEIELVNNEAFDLRVGFVRILINA